MFADSERWQIWIRLAELHPRADVFEVLVPPLIFLRVSRKVRIHNAHTRVMEFKPYGNTTFVTLKEKYSAQKLFCTQQMNPEMS